MAKIEIRLNIRFYRHRDGSFKQARMAGMAMAAVVAAMLMGIVSSQTTSRHFSVVRHEKVITSMMDISFACHRRQIKRTGQRT
ncbi:hypothetical protein GCM10027181_22290 [Rheinheimera gaetbuli]